MMDANKLGRTAAHVNAHGTRTFTGTVVELDPTRGTAVLESRPSSPYCCHQKEVPEHELVYL